MNTIGYLLVRILALLLFLIIIVAAFVAGGLAHRYERYESIPGMGYIIELLDPSFFYPAFAQGNSEIMRVDHVSYPFSFIVYGDSREPATEAKTAIINQVIEEAPGFVLNLGDMVYCGNEHQWEIFDLFEGKVIEKGIPFYPVLGNHEYRSLTEVYPEDPEEQLQHFFQRFQFLEERRWYSLTYGVCTILVLDTSTEYDPESLQYQWLENQLHEKKSGFVLVALHYPPHTKSGHGRHEEKLLATLFEAGGPDLRKPDIVFSGHVHNYERYMYNDVTYVISGGGGAPPHAVKRGHDDLYNKSGDTYHYCRVTVSPSKLVVDMVRWRETTGAWSVDDTFTLSLDRKEAAL